MYAIQIVYLAVKKKKEISLVWDTQGEKGQGHTVVLLL